MADQESQGAMAGQGPWPLWAWLYGPPKKKIIGEITV